MDYRLTLWLISVIIFVCSHINVSFSDIIIGADMSYLDDEDCIGKCSPFKSSSNGATQDALSILKTNKFTTIRMRIWNDPTKPSNQYCNLTGVLIMANRTFSNNLKYHLDFHYSDTWADPGHQTKPAAWSSLYGQDLINAVYNFTFKVLRALKDQNTLPQSVQIGNEITNGMLWANQGEPCDHGGYISNPCQNNWDYFAKLVGAGVNATRDIDKDIEIMIHTDLGNRLAQGQSAVNYIKQWYNKLYTTYNVKFDSIGLSFYPSWCKCDLNQLLLLNNLMDNFPDLTGGLYIVETSYPYNPNITYSWNSTYPFTPNGQLQYVQALMNIVNDGKINGLRGIMWWGTEYYQSTAQQWASLWDWNGVALPALLQGF